jgi:hypothetical protein
VPSPGEGGCSQLARLLGSPNVPGHPSARTDGLCGGLAAGQAFYESSGRVPPEVWRCFSAKLWVFWRSSWGGYAPRASGPAGADATSGELEGDGGCPAGVAPALPAAGALGGALRRPDR